jgi:23S rRNA (uracil1939-C5)-methyltransferase
MTSAQEPQHERIPLEPARSVRAVVALHGWTDEGLARGTVTADADERLPAGAEIAVLGGIPGETVEVEVGWPAIWRPKQKKHPKPPIMRLVRVLIPSPERVAAPCPVFGDCGGCRLQHIPYKAQLQWKQARVQSEMAAHGIAEVVVLPALGMANPWNFRNQMRFAINRDGQPGLTAYGTHRVIPLHHCPIAEQRINDTLAALSGVVNPRPQVLIRCGKHTGEELVQPAPEGERAAALVASGITPRTDGLREQLHGLTFAMRPSSFFQTNTLQAEVMADLVLAAVPAGPAATVADAYCGVGTFAALLATRAGHVIAIEESASAVRDAHENLAALGLENVEVIQGRTEELLPGVAARIDAVVLDPPRMGCQRPVLDAILARGIPRVVYVSCDPATLARDLAILTSDGRYAIRSVQPLDMFPQTHHIECVAVVDAVSGTDN